MGIAAGVGREKAAICKGSPAPCLCDCRVYAIAANSALNISAAV